jgi:hypothetical protein
LPFIVMIWPGTPVAVLTVREPLVCGAAPLGDVKARRGTSADAATSVALPAAACERTDA